MTRTYEIGEKSSKGPPFTSPLGKLAIIYLIIKAIGSIRAQRYSSPLMKLQILYHFYDTTLSAGMLYTKHEHPYLSMRTAVILHVLGLKRNSLPSLTVHLVAIHPEQVVRHSMWTLVFLRTSFKHWEDGPPKPGSYTFMITLPYVLNYSLRLYASHLSCLIAPYHGYSLSSLFTTSIPTPNIISLS